MIVYFSGSKHIFLILYIDDILLASNNTCLLHETKRFLARKFEMKDLGDAFFVLAYRYTGLSGYCWIITKVLYQEST